MLDKKIEIIYPYYYLKQHATMSSFKVTRYCEPIGNGQYRINEYYSFKEGHLMKRTVSPENKYAYENGYVEEIGTEEEVHGPEYPEEIAPFMKFFEGGCQGRCPCYVIRADRFGMGGEIWGTAFIEDCQFCKGDYKLSWIDESEDSKETEFNRKDRLLVISIQENHCYNTAYIQKDGEKTRVFTHGEDDFGGEEYEELHEPGSLTPFVSFFEKGSKGQCPCYAIMRDRHLGLRAGKKIYKISSCKCCNGIVPVIWEDEESKPTDLKYIGQETLENLQPWKPYAQRYAIRFAQQRIASHEQAIKDLREMIGELQDGTMSFKEAGTHDEFMMSDLKKIQ
jgi:hypothetical protein